MRFIRFVGSLAMGLLQVPPTAIAQSELQPVPDNVRGDQTPNGGLQPPPAGGASLHDTLLRERVTPSKRHLLLFQKTTLPRVIVCDPHWAFLLP
jgi:hypothetical protein